MLVKLLFIMTVFYNFLSFQATIPREGSGFCHNRKHLKTRETFMQEQNFHLRSIANVTLQNKINKSIERISSRSQEQKPSLQTTEIQFSPLKTFCTNHFNNLIPTRGLFQQYRLFNRPDITL